MPILRIAITLALIISAVALWASALTEADLPAGSRAQVRLVDYVNTEHQPLGYTLRGIVEGDVAVGGKVVVPDKSRVLMRLVADSSSEAYLTVEFWAVKFGDDWSEFRNAAEGSGLFTTLTKAEDRRAPIPDSRPLTIAGPALYIPYHSILHFEIRRPVRLLNVGRLKL